MAVHDYRQQTCGGYEATRGETADMSDRSSEALLLPCTWVLIGMSITFDGFFGGTEQWICLHLTEGADDSITFGADYDS